LEDADEVVGGLPDGEAGVGGGVPVGGELVWAEEADEPAARREDAGPLHPGDRGGPGVGEGVGVAERAVGGAVLGVPGDGPAGLRVVVAVAEGLVEDLVDEGEGGADG